MKPERRAREAKVVKDREREREKESEGGEVQAVGEGVCVLDFQRGRSVRFSLRRSGRSSDFCLCVFPGVCTHHLSHEALQLHSGTTAAL